MSKPTRATLEPIAGPVVAVALAHVLLGMLLWIFLPLWKTSHPNEKAAKAQLTWTTPDAFLLGRQQPPATPPKPAKEPPAKTPIKAPAPQPVAATPAATPPAPMAPAPQPTGPLRAANKYITISPRHTESPTGAAKPPEVQLADFGLQSPPKPGIADLGTVDNALQQIYLKEWAPPAIQLVPAGKRSASLNVSIGRDGTIWEAKLTAPSNGDALDLSIMEVADQVKKIPVSLPSSFPKERYDLQVNFQIE